MAAMSGHGYDARYECEASCGFRGTFDAVHKHEKECAVMKASIPGATAKPSSVEDLMALAQAQLDSPGSPTSPTSAEPPQGLGAAAEPPQTAAAAAAKKKKGISFGGIPPEPEPEPSSRPNRVMQGWLTKQGHIRRNWKSRFFVVRLRVLRNPSPGQSGRRGFRCPPSPPRRANSPHTPPPSTVTPPVSVRRLNRSGPRRRTGGYVKCASSPHTTALPRKALPRPESPLGYPPSLLPNTPTPQHPNIPTPQHATTPTPQHPNTPTPQQPTRSS